MKIWIFFALGILTLAASCENSDSSSGEVVSAKSEIRARNQAWIRAEAGKNLEATLGFIAEDGVYLANDWPTMRGHEEVSRFLNAAFAMEIDTITGGPDFIKVARSGELAYEVGHTEVAVSAAKGDTVYKTHYLVVWEKQSGVWKAAATSISGVR